MDPVALARLNAGLRNLLVELLARRVRDPRVQAVSVTGVKVSGDLAVAKVFYSVLGSETAQRQAQLGLETAAGFLRREASRHLRLRSVPELRFVHDPSLERGAHIDQLLHEIQEQAGKPQAPAEPEQPEEPEDG